MMKIPLLLLQQAAKIIVVAYPQSSPATTYITIQVPRGVHACVSFALVPRSQPPPFVLTASCLSQSISSPTANTQHLPRFREMLRCPMYYHFTCHAPHQCGRSRGRLPLPLTSRVCPASLHGIYYCGWCAPPPSTRTDEAAGTRNRHTTHTPTHPTQPNNNSTMTTITTTLLWQLSRASGGKGCFCQSHCRESLKRHLHLSLSLARLPAFARTGGGCTRAHSSCDRAVPRPTTLQR